MKFHIVGMTLGEEAELYIIEPYNEPENDSNRKKGVRNQRKILKRTTGSELERETQKSVPLATGAFRYIPGSCSTQEQCK